MVYINHILRYMLLILCLHGLKEMPGFSQTCCSGGVPLSVNLGFEGAAKGTLQTEWSYHLNYLATLKNGNEIYEDESRQRIIHSFLLKLGYSVNNWFAIDALFSYVLQERKIFFNDQILLPLGCDGELGIFGGTDTQGSGDQENWSIPVDEIFDGGPGKDGIPALTDPEFISAESAEYLDNEDLVGNVNIAISYCPLTGTGIGWNRRIDGKVTTFGVSGLLYNSNLIPYDRETDSLWSQMRLDCVNGELKGMEVETYPVVETTWLTWKKMYPGTKVLSRNTGYNLSYGNYPYGNYRTEDSYLIFPVANEDNRIPNKERVLGVVLDGVVRIYKFTDFGESLNVLQDSLEGNKLVIIGSHEDNFMLAFRNNTEDETMLSFSAVLDRYPVVMKDNEGNMWDVKGRAVAGPRSGDSLGIIPSFMGYWFSFAAFYPDLTIYGES